MKVDLSETSKISEIGYYSLMATLHCIIMQQAHLFDSSIILIEQPGSLLVGFALRGY